MGAAFCAAQGGEPRFVEAVVDSETEEDGTSVWRKSALFSEKPPDVIPDGTSGSTADTPDAVQHDTVSGDGKPKMKSALKRLNTASTVGSSAGSEETPNSTTGSTRKLKIGKSFEQHIPMKSDSERGLRIAYGNQDIKRTNTYAALGLGYLINSAMHEVELARRSKSEIYSHRKVFVSDEEATTPEFGDCYILEDEIASGGFGTIYKCASRVPGGPQLAVKQVFRHSVIGCKAVELFNVEATVLKDFDHPNLAWRAQTFLSHDALYLVMEYCKGESLFERLCMRGPMSKRVNGRIAHNLASGLACLHENGIMHRDIKPENVMFDSDRLDSKVKIIDFGVARTFEPGEVVKTQVGTLAYIAPEMIVACYSEKVDVWALGVTLFLSTTGCLPMHSKFDDELCHFILEGRIAWYLINFLDPQLLGLVKGCLEKEPQERLSAADIAKQPWLIKAAAPMIKCCGIAY